MIAVYCLLLNTFVLRYTKGEQIELVDNGHLSKWQDAFVFCDDQSYWKQLVNDCQPETCNGTDVADKIINKFNLERQQYWIYGYVLRSPVIVNKGCFSLKVNQSDNFPRDKFSFQQNSAFECAMACPSTTVGYIFLMGTECLCIPNAFINSYSEESTDACTIYCQGNNGDLCGGVSSVVGEEIYSAYEIVNRKNPPGMQLGNTCASAYWSNTDKQHRFSYTRCSTNLLFICQSYNKTSKVYNDDCNDETASWYDARQKCHNKSLILTSNIKNWCPQAQHWVGTHVTERIIWGNVSLPRDALCLKLVVNGSEVRLETENCHSKLYSLCYVTQHMSSEKENTEATIKQSTISAGRPTLRSPINAKSDEDNTTNFVPIVAGSVGGFVAIVIFVIIVLIVKRRTKSNNKHVNTTVDQGQSETYSEPIKNTIPEESRKLVNVTEEGIYNHLGDSEKMIEMKPQDSSIYDITGDDEYHVFTASGKQQKFKDDNDLYDHGAASDVYNTLNDTVTTNRPESDTYNIINTK